MKEFINFIGLKIVNKYQEINSVLNGCVQYL